MSREESIDLSPHRYSPGEPLTPSFTSAHSSPKRRQPQQHRNATTHPRIKIEPTCLVFPPPHYGRCIQNAVSIYNVSKQPCVFKMRSQNPDRYVVKPHVAIVAPESATRIFVTLRDMNTLGIKNLPEDTQERFRLSLRLYDSVTVDPSLPPKELWSLLMGRGAPVDHEQDLIAYFTKMETPVGGLVIFFPPTYLPVLASKVADTASPHTLVTTSECPPNSASGSDAAAVCSRAPNFVGSHAGISSSARCISFKRLCKCVAVRGDLLICLVVVSLVVLYVSVMTYDLFGVGLTAPAVSSR